MLVLGCSVLLSGQEEGEARVPDIWLSGVNNRSVNIMSEGKLTRVVASEAAIVAEQPQW